MRIIAPTHPELGHGAAIRITLVGFLGFGLEYNIRNLLTGFEAPLKREPPLKS